MGSSFSGGDVEEDIAFLDGVRAVPEAASRKSELAQRLQVQPDDTVVEVGPGTGEDLQQLARSAGAGVGIGIELSEGLAAEAKRRAGQPNVSFVVGDVRQLPLRSRSVDAVHVERVLQHVEHVEEAMAELSRVCRGGARLLAFEPDQELRAHDHPDREVERLLRARAASRYANPTIGRRLYGLLVESGFGDITVVGTVTCTSGATVSVTSQVAEAVAEGELDAERAERYVAELERRDADALGFSIWVAFEVRARRTVSERSTRTVEISDQRERRPSASGRANPCENST